MFCWSGKPVFGVSGELVCVKPFPSQPTQFWNDPDGSKYKKAYFDKFPGKRLICIFASDASVFGYFCICR